MLKIGIDKTKWYSKPICLLVALSLITLVGGAAIGLLVFQAQAAPSWPTSWISIDPDPQECGPPDLFRDVQEAYYNFDADYLYLRLYNRDLPEFTKLKQGRWKWLFSLEANPLSQSGQTILGAEYLLFVEDFDDDYVDGEVYFLDAGGDEAFNEYEPSYYDPVPGEVNSTVGGYRIDGWNVDLYIKLSELKVGGVGICTPAGLELVWATDQENPNLEQMPTCDGTDAGDIPVTTNPVIEVTKTDSPDPVDATASITYNVTIPNSGNISTVDYTGNEFEDSIPGNTTYAPGTIMVDGSPNDDDISDGIGYDSGNNQIIWNGGIPNGGSVTIVFQVAVQPCLTNGTQISNQGTFHWDSDGDCINDASEPTDDPSTGTDDDPTVTTVNFVPPVADAGSDPAAICEGGYVVIGGSPTASGGTAPYSYLWTPDDGTLNSTTVSNPSASPTSTTTYTLTVTDANGCSDDADTVVVVNALPVVTASNDSPKCEGQDVQLTGGPGGMINYTWTSPGGYLNYTQSPVLSNVQLSDADTYTLTVTDAQSCTNSTSTDVLVNVCGNQPPNQPPNVSPIDGDTCVSLPATLQSGPFSDPDPGDTHAASHWQVITSTGNFGSPFFNSTTDINLTSITLDVPTLHYDTTYFWRVRHQDNDELWSDWSLDTSFTTCDTPDGEPVEIIRDNIEIEFANVTVSGCTDVTKSNRNPGGPLPDGFCPLLPFVHITTTADYTGPVVVGLPYNDFGMDVDKENALRVFHLVGTSWQEVTYPPHDTLINIAYGEDNVLSWWCIGGDCPEGKGVPAFPSLYMGIVAALGAGILAYFIRRRLTRQE